jgi:hypothetical protein
MRYAILITIISIFFVGCKKDNVDNAPQITFESIVPNSAFSNIPISEQQIPILTIHVKENGWNLGFVAGQDTSYVFVTNILTGRQDSLLFPDVSSAATNNFDADVQVSLATVLGGSGGPGPKTDTLYFKVYVRDFAKHASDTITTPVPVYYITPQ